MSGSICSPRVRRPTSTCGCSAVLNDCGAPGHLERQILDVDLLDREDGALLGSPGAGCWNVGHDAFLRKRANARFYATAASAKRALARAVAPGDAAVAREQRREPAGAVERDQVLVAADVDVADVDLRHGAAAGALHHRHRARRDRGRRGSSRSPSRPWRRRKRSARTQYGTDVAVEYIVIVGRAVGHLTSPPAGRPSSTPRSRRCSV